MSYEILMFGGSFLIGKEQSCRAEKLNFFLHLLVICRF